MSIRQYIPPGVRLFIKTRMRKVADMYSGDYSLFASRKQSSESFDHEITIVQVIRKNAHFENKIHNLQQGIAAISGTVLHPRQVFSFWHHVGRPDRAHGFVLSRNIVSGQVSEDYGGGLCQLSSIIYHLSLRAGLEIRERYNHSVDIYREEDRFTPLGADATVVYGYKDLRVQNQLEFPVMIRLEIKGDQLYCSFSSPKPIAAREIDFQRTVSEGKVEVNAVDVLDGRVIAKSNYKI